jgi:signal transduction histidine kinase
MTLNIIALALQITAVIFFWLALRAQDRLIEHWKKRAEMIQGHYDELVEAVTGKKK